MSQRGGDVQSNLRLSSDPINSDRIAKGQADVIISMEPVSYTHLVAAAHEAHPLVEDVAVRLAAMEEVLVVLFLAQRLCHLGDTSAVSYTHLDVYKRQSTLSKGRGCTLCG